MTMIKITVGNSYSTISNLTKEQLQTLQDNLSVKSEGYGFFHIGPKTFPKCYLKNGTVWVWDIKGIPCRVVNSRFRPYTSLSEVKNIIGNKREKVFAKGNIYTCRPLINRKGEFPTGLLKQAWKCVETFEKAVQWVDDRPRPKPTPGMFKLKLGKITPYPEQIEAANACAKWHRALLSMPTGSGKSITAALIINQLQVKTLIVVPTLNLKFQLSETLKELFGDLSYITICNIDSPELETAKDYDLLIVDESHHSAAATYQRLNKKAWTGIYYRVFLTATPFRTKTEEQILMEAITGPLAYKLTQKDAVDRGLILPVEVYYYNLPKTKMRGNTRDWREVYSELVVKNEYRNKLIVNLITNLNDVGQSSLTLIKEIAHGQELSGFSGAAFVHGQAEDGKELIEWFSDGRLKSLIGTTGVVSEGIDTKAAEWLILGAGGKSPVSLCQSIGRGVRKFGNKTSCKVVLFRDESNAFLLKHFDEQLNTIRTLYDIEPCELELPEVI